MKVLSVFDGMACGMIAMMLSGIMVDEYVAYEIDKYAVQTSSHNFPFIKHKGDVFEADFTEYEGFDWLVGGSPCTYWSIAQTKNRETVASGMGWELFKQYVRALEEAKPKYFIYENNKSMSKAIKESITETFEFEPICINSALLSAQNRNRLYWCGIRQEDGTYRQAKIEQPKDKGILLKDILETNHTTWQEKNHTKRLIAVKPLSEKEMDYMVRDTKGFKGSNWNFLNDPKSDDKSMAVLANFSKGIPYNVCAEPINITESGKSQTIKSQYAKNSVSNFVGYDSTYGATGVAYNVQECFKAKENTKKGYTEIQAGYCVDLTMANSKTRRGRSMKDKSNCLQTSCEFYEYCGTVKTPIYEVKNGMITVKDKKYPIKLVDGYYIIRKLTVRECMRLQTVPEWYEFPVSNSQAYKMLGNGWTCEVISHLIRSILSEKCEEPTQRSIQMSIFDFLETKEKANG